MVIFYSVGFLTDYVRSRAGYQENIAKFYYVLIVADFI